jgi:hypothetical protein
MGWKETLINESSVIVDVSWSGKTSPSEELKTIIAANTTHICSRFRRPV